MNFWDVFSNLLNQKGYNPSSLASELEMPKTTIYKWKDGSSPSLDKLELIADALGVTLDELAGRTPPQHTEQETQLLETFKKLSVQDQNTILNMVDFLSSR